MYFSISFPLDAILFRLPPPFLVHLTSNIPLLTFTPGEYRNTNLYNCTTTNLFILTSSLFRDTKNGTHIQIEKQAQYLLKTPFAKIKMSDIESGYAERYQSLMFKHFNNCVVGNIPERLGRLDEDEMSEL